MIADSISKAKKEKLRDIPYNFNLDSFAFSTVSASSSLSPATERSVPGIQQRWQTAQQGSLQEAQLDPPSNCKSQVHIDPYNLSHSLTLNDSEFRAGSLREKIHVWRKITSDQQILKLISGISLTFTERPYQEKFPHEIQFTGNFKTLVQKELDKFLLQGIIEKSQWHDGDFLSNLFARPKKTPGEIRLILNLKFLNLFVPTVHFKMESLDVALKLLRPNMYMASIDLTNSFYHLLVKPRYRKFLKFSSLGQLYQFTSLPMGFKHSPLLFTKLMKAPLGFLRANYGCILVCYIDDILILGSSALEVQKSVAYVANLLQMLGFHINAEKSELKPSQSIEFLGFILNSVDMTVRLTDDKILKITELATKVLEQPTFSIRFLAQFIGNCVATFPAVEFGPYHTKELEREKAEALKQNHMDFEATMSISEWATLHVTWWRENVQHAITSLVAPPLKEQIHMFCDASTVGWGIYFPLTDSHTGGLWNLQEQSLHINVLEILSILFGLKIYFSSLHHETVHIHTDNQVALFSLRAQGSTKSPWCNKYTAKIMQFMEERNLHFIVSYIRSQDNVHADTASRVYQHDLEWSIPDEVFKTICQKWGTPDIDLFASRLNHKVPKYCSWKPDPYAFAIDAFSIDWTDFNLVYIFSPTSLITKVLKTWQDLQVSQEKTSHNAIIVAPCWTTQPWFPVLQQLTQEPPLQFHSDQLILHHRPQEKHRLKYKILVYKL